MTTLEQDTGVLRLPKQHRAVERRKTLVESAALLFERDGFAESTLVEIGRQANSTTGSIYFYFRNKHELARAVIQEQNARTFDALSNGRAASLGAEGLLLASKRLADLLLTDPVVRAGIRLSLEQNSVASDTADFYRQWIESLEQTYHELQAAGELRTDISAKTMSRTAVPFFTGIHLMSEMVDDWAELYRDMIGMWEILIRGTVVSEKQPDLLKFLRRLFRGPQPALSRNRRSPEFISTNAPDM